jgi:DNA-binding CsgD family transcriptional regulator
MEGAMSSNVLKRFVYTLSNVAVAVVHTDEAELTFTNFFDGTHEERHLRKSLSNLRADRIEVAQIWRHELSASDLVNLDHSVRDAMAPVAGPWQAMDMQLSDGSIDSIALQLDPAEDFDLTKAYLRRIWPILRQDCIAEAQQLQKAQLEYSGTGWDVLNRIDVATLIVDGAGLMYRMNIAARETLENAVILRRGKGGVFAVDDHENRTFRSAIASCAAGPVGEDRIVFLTSRDDEHKVPVTLSRYVHEGEPTSYVIVMLPIPPSRKRVERLVRQMGLTSAEARVAALIQLGLTNREAAKVLGIKTQTFNTYSKRALSKLNVSGRTEMAQLLTWQAAGGRTS